MHTPSSFSALRWGGLAVLGIALCVSYWPAFLGLTAYWAANDMYSYGYLVPIISGYLIWLRREELRALPVSPSLVRGTLLLGAGVAMLIVGRASSTNLLQWLSLPVTIAGLCLLILGVPITRAMTFPLLYLLAMVPFWDIFTARLHQPFQLYSAIMGVGALRLFDLPVIREGFLIHLPNITLEVADVCSGVNQLVAIMCIGIPVAHMHIKAWTKRAVVVLAAAAIALLSNGARVALISLYAVHGMTGPDGDVHGPYSTLRTTAISAVGFVVLFWLIARLAEPGTATAASANVSFAGRATRRLSSPALTIAIALTMSPAALAQWRGPQDVPLGAQLAAFPTSIGGWHFRGLVSVTPAVDAIGFDHVLSRRYASPEGTEIEFLLGYFARQRQGRELAGFEVGQMLSSDTGRFTRTIEDGFRVVDFFTTRRGERYYIAYWYGINGRIVENNYLAKLWMTWDSLVWRRNSGSIGVVRTKVAVDESLEDARAKVGSFLDALVPAYARYIP